MGIVVGSKSKGSFDCLRLCLTSVRMTEDLIRGMRIEF
jgi:hypothetical protein